MNIGGTHAMSGKIVTEALSCVVCQMAPYSARTMADVDRNVDQILDYMDKATSGFPGYDLIVTPECALQGFDPEYWLDVMVEKDGPQVQRLKDKCKELSVWGVFNPWVRGARQAGSAELVDHRQQRRRGSLRVRQDQSMASG